MPCGCCCSPRTVQRSVHTTTSLTELYDALQNKLPTSYPGDTDYTFTVSIMREGRGARAEDITSLLKDIKFSHMGIYRSQIDLALLQCFEEVQWVERKELTLSNVTLGAPIEALLGCSGCSRVNFGKINNTRAFFRDISLKAKSEGIRTKEIHFSNIERGLHLFSVYSILREVTIDEESTRVPFARKDVELLFKSTANVGTLEKIIYSTVNGTGFFFEGLLADGGNQVCTKLSCVTDAETLRFLGLNEGTKQGIHVEVKIVRPIKAHYQFLSATSGCSDISVQLGVQQFYTLKNEFLKDRYKEAEAKLLVATGR